LLNRNRHEILASIDRCPLTSARIAPDHSAGLVARVFQEQKEPFVATDFVLKRTQGPEATYVGPPFKIESGTRDITAEGDLSEKQCAGPIKVGQWLVGFDD
jgi:hypothetical protein